MTMPTAKVKRDPKHDQKKVISNEFYETKYVADKYAIPVWKVYFLKHTLGTNDRAQIVAAIQNLPEATTPIENFHKIAD